MSTAARAKLHKSLENVKNPLAETIAQSLLDIENSSSELKSEIKELQIVDAKEIELTLKNQKQKKGLPCLLPIPNTEDFTKTSQENSPRTREEIKNTSFDCC